MLVKPLAVGAACLALAGGLAACGDSDTKTTTTTAPAATQPAAQDIVALAAATPDLSTLVKAVTAADLAKTLQGMGPFTVFAPDNAAFAALPKATLTDLLSPAGKEDLTNILTYHVVPGELKAADLTDGQMLKTVNGKDLTVSIKDGKVYVNDAEVIQPDVDASNGVVHVINGVLTP